MNTVPVHWKLKAKRGAFLVSAEDVERVLAFSRRWCFDAKGYLVAGNRTKAKLHRVIMQAPKELHVDHRNNDRADNRRINLRIVDNSTNLLNCAPRKGKIRGVKTNGGKFYAVLQGRHLPGAYATASDAGLAYDRALREHVGDDAHFNFPCAFIGER